jgi:hypothetical protein
VKSLEDIRSEFLGQLREEDDKHLTKVREARDERDALLQRAGITEAPGELDDAHYLRCIRELVFQVPDAELRREIMHAVSNYRSEMCERWVDRGLFEEQFAARLRSQRCRPPQPSAALAYLPYVVTVVLLGAWTFCGPLDALVIGVSFLFSRTVLSRSLHRGIVPIRCGPTRSHQVGGSAYRVEE